MPLREVWEWLDNHGFHLEQTDEGPDSLEAFQDLELGHFLWRELPHYSCIIRKAELLPMRKRNEITSQKQYLELIRQKPTEWEVGIRFMTKKPKNYKSEVFGE